MGLDPIDSDFIGMWVFGLFDPDDEEEVKPQKPKNKKESDQKK